MTRDTTAAGASVTGRPVPARDAEAQTGPGWSTAARVPERCRTLSVADAETYVASVCFKTGPPGPVGVEIEQVVHDRHDPGLPVTAGRVRSALAPAGGLLPGGGVISFEPGGQVEISSACAADLASLLAATRADYRTVNDLLAADGLYPGPLALDPLRAPTRSLDHPRYAAMERHFDRAGREGLVMMCSTAAVQISVEAGHPGEGPQSAVERWNRLHRLAPVLVAMFANSPFRHRAPSGWKSTRHRVWAAIDPTRTTPVTGPARESDPALAWARYALEANVLCIRSAGADWDAPRGLTMRDWLNGRGPRPVTMGDLEYHLTTLFPPVRPRGYLELRVIDAQEGADWEAATAVVTALMEDPQAAEAADVACAALEGRAGIAEGAARDGLENPMLAAAARACADAVLAALPRFGADRATIDRVGGFLEKYTLRGRSPADERLDHWHRTGSFFLPSSQEQS
ncbi:ergothioneine biosynthesis glutamate--cysteine ligase EgtA [Arthrobacter sp. NQ7]|uniref:ergothioneine biosynthesis glutamate--cysteine ligase EgtA n=1 Tax=Arthrobacter sp. NQ7 TaxID=3032303 RepID=UPI00240ED92F|nr:ergothioneine biosynthesis glutamate--cysteine ligase EgtA [Arthrobacter sp. NQ7]MDJ0458009.1 ergothioneine biosynthesis glutamate--cysteine ligase EgtA [Arthrobacter sp. NQ7]